MSWKGVTIMDQRVRFISEYLNALFPFSELCRQFEVSRKTGYKWVNRYREYGVEGLTERSRRPHQCPHHTPEEIIQAIIDARTKHPSWGPKKLLNIISTRHSNWELPAISTTADILKREGLIKPGKRRLRRKHPGCPKTTTDEPNDIWTADYKGHFKMKNGLYCYPLTVCDMHSRYLLACDGHKAISIRDSTFQFIKLFEEFGLPKRIRTDNGVPFASSALARLSSLSVWWIKLGIYPEQIEPGKPQQNGKHERMHRTLKKEATIPPGQNLKGQQRKFNEFKKEYNEIRPHEALNMQTPSAVYRPSKRRMPRKVKTYDYPSHFQVRLVSRNGGIRWKHDRVPVSSTLIKEYIGFEEVDNDIYNVYFCDILIGRFFEEILRIKDVISRVPTKPRVVKECYPCTQKKV